MSNRFSERRLAENEVLAKQANERVGQGLAELKALAEEHHQLDLSSDSNVPLYFYCECSDINCEKRIKLKPSEYTQLHQNHDQFLLWPEHNIPTIERIVKSEKYFIVVEKYMSAPQKVDPAKRA